MLDRVAQGLVDVYDGDPFLSPNDRCALYKDRVPLDCIRQIIADNEDKLHGVHKAVNARRWKKELHDIAEQRRNNVKDGCLSPNELYPIVRINNQFIKTDIHRFINKSDMADMAIEHVKLVRFGVLTTTIRRPTRPFSK